MVYCQAAEIFSGSLTTFPRPSVAAASFHGHDRLGAAAEIETSRRSGSLPQHVRQMLCCVEFFRDWYTKVLPSLIPGKSRSLATALGTLFPRRWGPRMLFRRFDGVLIVALTAQSQPDERGRLIELKTLRHAALSGTRRAKRCGAAVPLSDRSDRNERVVHFWPLALAPLAAAATSMAFLSKEPEMFNPHHLGGTRSRPWPCLHQTAKRLQPSLFDVSRVAS